MKVTRKSPKYVLPNSDAPSAEPKAQPSQGYNIEDFFSPGSAPSNTSSGAAAPVNHSSENVNFF